MLLLNIPLNVNNISFNEDYNYIINYKYIYNLYEKCFIYILNLIMGLI